MAAPTDFPHASPVDGIRFTAQVGIPSVVTGLFKKRALPTRAASLVRIEAQGHALVRGLVKRMGTGPFWVRVAAEEALLVTDPDDVRFVLENSPGAFASDPETKADGMAAFQPEALSISRDEAWRTRRDFAEAVLDTGKPLHRYAKQFGTVAAEEAAALVAAGSTDYEALHEAVRRMTRRVVFGDHAAADLALHDELEALMSLGNSTPGEPGEGYQAFVDHIDALLAQASPRSLGSLIAATNQTGLGTDGAAGQVIHWLFAMGDTLAANLHRALALLASHPEQLREVLHEIDAGNVSTAAGVGRMGYLAGCLQEAMRLWPTTPLFARVTATPVTFPQGVVIGEGKQVLIYNVFNHRDRDRVPYADKFAPHEWTTGEAGNYWGFNFFSHGPQGCPGAGLSIFLGQALIANALATSNPTLSGATLQPTRPLPSGLDLGFTIEWSPR